MTPELENFKRDIISLIEQHSGNRDFNTLLNALLSDINDLSNARLGLEPIVERMFMRLNEGREQPFDSRAFSPANQILAPIAMSLIDLAILVETMRIQVFVHSASGINLDNLGRDYDFPRSEASRAIRRGFTLDTQGDKADFPIGSRFATRDTQLPIIFEIFESLNGDVLFRHVPDPNVPFMRGDVANQYFGDLSPASPINGIGRATITHDYIPGENYETDEDYRRRFLRFLRRRAFGGNVAQYQEETFKIAGVGDLMVFPVWRGEGTVKISIVDTNNYPVSDEFVEIVNNHIDPVLRSGTGYGIAPIGHRVTVQTPKWVDIYVHVPVVLMRNIALGQAKPRLEELLIQYFVGLRQGILDEWERSYFANDGIAIAYVDLLNDINALFGFMTSNQSNFTGNIAVAYQNMLNMLEWFPAEKAKQTHNFETRIQPQDIGVLFRSTGLILAVDFLNISINGSKDQNGYQMWQNEENQFMPRLAGFELEAVDYIQPMQPPSPPVDTDRYRYTTGFDNPMSELVKIVE